MDEITIKSPAKINLGLNVIRKRSDGFHDIETVFYPLLLSDILKIKKSSKNNFTSNSDELNSKKDNLILSAKTLIEKTFKKKLNVEIILEKNIPIGGGLGGGSSNAALTLIGLNRLFNLNLSFTELSDLALELGSDVPFFLNPQPSYAESRGEKLSPVPIAINYPILLINPGINISTSWAFSEITPTKPEFRIKEIFSEVENDFKSLKNKLKNDFENIVFKKYPEIEKIKINLYELGADFAMMSGSGSSVYGIFNNLQKASYAEDYFKLKYFTYLNNPFTEGSFT